MTEPNHQLCVGDRMAVLMEKSNEQKQMVKTSST